MMLTLSCQSIKDIKDSLETVELAVSMSEIRSSVEELEIDRLSQLYSAMYKPSSQMKVTEQVIKSTSNNVPTQEISAEIVEDEYFNSEILEQLKILYIDIYFDSEDCFINLCVLYQDTYFDTDDYFIDFRVMLKDEQTPSGVSEEATEFVESEEVDEDDTESDFDSDFEDESEDEDDDFDDFSSDEDVSVDESEDEDDDFDDFSSDEDNGDDLDSDEEDDDFASEDEDEEDDFTSEDDVNEAEETDDTEEVVDFDFDDEAIEVVESPEIMNADMEDEFFQSDIFSQIEWRGMPQEVPMHSMPVQGIFSQTTAPNVSSNIISRSDIVNSNATGQSAEEIAVDLLAFLKQNGKSDEMTIHRHYGKKEIQKALASGRVIKRKGFYRLA